MLVCLVQSRLDALTMAASLDLLEACKCMAETLHQSIIAAKSGQKVSIKQWREAMNEGHKAIAKAVGASVE